MLLSRIFEHLTHVTLSQLALSGSDIGQVDMDDYPQLITLTNSGMLDLYTRFPLRMRELPLQLQEGQTIYELHSDYSESSGTIPPLYITDGTLLHPFTDNILTIDQVYDEIGDPLPLNDLNQPNSVFTPSNTTLQVPLANKENSLAIIYRALPDVIDITTQNPTSVDVDLPPQFLNAIASFIAWKLYTPMGGEGNIAISNSFLADYLNQIKLIEDKGAVITDVYTNTRFEENRWV